MIFLSGIPKESGVLFVGDNFDYCQKESSTFLFAVIADNIIVTTKRVLLLNCAWFRARASGGLNCFSVESKLTCLSTEAVAITLQ